MFTFSPASHFGSAIAFFIFEVPKVLIATFLAVVGMGILIVGYLFNFYF